MWRVVLLILSLLSHFLTKAIDNCEYMSTALSVFVVKKWHLDVEKVVCSGVVLKYDAFLTVATCFTKEAANLFVPQGGIELKDNKWSRKMAKVIVHPNAHKRGPYVFNNLAIGYVKVEFDLSYKYEHIVDTANVMSSWLTQGRIANCKLLQVEKDNVYAIKLNTWMCDLHEKYKNDGLFCLETEMNIDENKWLSGGPVICNRVIYGIGTNRISSERIIFKLLFSDMEDKIINGSWSEDGEYFTIRNLRPNQPISRGELRISSVFLIGLLCFVIIWIDD